LHNPDIFDPRAEMFCNDLRQRGFESLSVRSHTETRCHRAGCIDAHNRGFGAGVNRHPGRY